MKFLTLLTNWFSDSNKYRDRMLEAEKTDAARQIKMDEIFTDPPYGFVVSVHCSYAEEEPPLLLEFQPKNPYEYNRHTCKHCGYKMKFTAIKANERFGKVFESPHLLSGRGDQIIGGISVHEYKTVKRCDKLDNVEKACLDLFNS